MKIIAISVNYKKKFKTKIKLIHELPLKCINYPASRNLPRNIKSSLKFETDGPKHFPISLKLLEGVLKFRIQFVILFCFS